MTKLLVWLWIYETKDTEIQVTHYAHTSLFRDAYERCYSTYLPCSNERLEDRPANNKIARTEVQLIFLVKKGYKPNKKLVSIPLCFEAPNSSIYQKPRKYKKLEYRITTSELQMEMEMLCQPGDAVV
jgi:hypothetical protein